MQHKNRKAARSNCPGNCKKKIGLKETNTRNIVTGWYTHDGLNNSGNALLTSYSQKMSPKQKQHTRPWHQSLLENSGLTPPRKK